MVENSLKMSHKESELDFLAGFCNSVLYFFLEGNVGKLLRSSPLFKSTKKKFNRLFIVLNIGLLRA